MCGPIADGKQSKVRVEERRLLFSLIFLLHPLLNRLEVETPVGADAESRQLLGLEEAIDRRLVHAEVFRNLADRKDARLAFHFPIFFH